MELIKEDGVLGRPGGRQGQRLWDQGKAKSNSWSSSSRGHCMTVKHKKTPQQVGLLARDEPERMPQAKCVTGLESDASPGRTMLGEGSFMGRGPPRKWVTCHLRTCRENPGILRKA